MDDQNTWRLIRKELEEIGITVAAFEANKDYIIDWFAEAVAGGAFTEQSPNDRATTPQSEYSPSPVESSQQPESSYDADEKFHSASPVIAAHSVRDFVTLDGDPHWATVQLKGNTLSPDAARGEAEKRLRVPRLAALMARLSLPNRALISAAEAGDYARAFQILQHKAKSSVIDQRTLNEALHASCRDGGTEIADLLLESEADVNSIMDWTGKAPLHLAACSGALAITGLLIQRKAKVNLRTHPLGTLDICLHHYTTPLPAGMRKWSGLCWRRKLTSRLCWRRKLTSRLSTSAQIGFQGQQQPGARRTSILLPS